MLETAERYDQDIFAGHFRFYIEMIGKGIRVEIC